MKPCEAPEQFSNTPCSYCEYETIQKCRKALYDYLSEEGINEYLKSINISPEEVNAIPQY